MELVAENGFLLALLLFLVVVAIGFPFYVWRARGRHWLSAIDRRRYVGIWKQIVSQKDLRHAVMDADKLVDEILGKRGYGGNFGEKLKRSEALFSDYNGLWGAHKLRNRLAHELSVSMSEGEGRRALRQFEKALKDLGLSM